MEPPHLPQVAEPTLIKRLALVLNSVAAVVLVTLMLITCVDVVGRYVFNKPLTGSTELTEMALAIVVFSVFPVISWRSEHVVVDIMDRFVSPRLDFIRTALFNVLAAVALCFVAQRIWVLGTRSLGYGEVSEYLAIPTGWIINFIAVMCVMAAVAMLTLGMYLAWLKYQQQSRVSANADDASERGAA